MNLLLQSIAKFLLGVIILGLLIFLPAGSFHYWQGWLLMGILFVPMFIAGLVMMAKNPAAESFRSLRLFLCSVSRRSVPAASASPSAESPGQRLRHRRHPHNIPAASDKHR